jgi:PAS domain S-box-containing protein
LFGYSDEDLEKGLNGLDMLVPENRERAKINMVKRLRGEDPRTAEYQALRKDGTTFPVLFHASSIAKDGELIGLRGIIVDITERKKVEENLHYRLKPIVVMYFNTRITAE